MLNGKMYANARRTCYSMKLYKFSSGLVYARLLPSDVEGNERRINIVVCSLYYLRLAAAVRYIEFPPLLILHQSLDSPFVIRHPIRFILNFVPVTGFSLYHDTEGCCAANFRGIDV